MADRRIVWSMLFVLLLALCAAGAYAQIPDPSIQVRPRPLPNAVAASGLGQLRNAEFGTIESMCSVGSQMYGAASGMIATIDETGRIKRSVNINVKSPVISAYGTDQLIVGDKTSKDILRFDPKTGFTALLINLMKVTDSAQGQIPGASLLQDSPLASVAFDGKYIYAGVSAGFSSSVFKIDPATSKVVASGFVAGPNPSAMIFHNGNLLVLDQTARQIRQFDSALKPSHTWTEVPVSDAKGISVINDEIRVLSQADKSIVKFNGNLAQLSAKPSLAVTVNKNIKDLIKAVAAPRKYAVLICGDIAEDFAGECFWNDTVWMYKTLLAAGYTPGNIYVLYGNGVDYNSANPTYKYAGVVTDFPATVGWVNKVFDGLKNGDAANGITQMRSQDSLFVWTFDHGGGDNAAYLCLWGGSMWDTDFAAKLNAVPCAKRVIYMQQCRSGGFIDNLRNGTTMISTACAANENAHPGDTEYETYGGKYYTHGEYNYYVISALAKSTPTDSPVNADSNGNGEVSCREAHNWMANRENQPETPQIDDASGVGNTFYIVN